MSETVRRYPNLATKVYDQHVYQPKLPIPKYTDPFVFLCMSKLAVWMCPNIATFGV
jgi:hypothetical protein